MIHHELVLTHPKQGLNNARAFVEELQEQRLKLINPHKASDADSFKRKFKACVSSIREVWHILKNSKLSNFEAESDNLEKDRAWQLIRQYRNQMSKEGTYPLEFESNYRVCMGLPFRMSDGSRSFMGSEGAYWVANEGTAKERDIPVQPTDKEVASYYWSMTPVLKLTSSDRKLLETSDPVQFCNIAIELVENFVHSFVKASIR